MLAKRALERVGIFHCLLDLHFHFSLVIRKILLKKETLQLSEDTLDAVCRTPASALFGLTLVLLENIQANVASKDIGMRDVVEDANGGRMTRIAHWEFELKMEDSSLVGSFLGASDVGVPSVVVLVKGTSSHTYGGDFLILNLLVVLH